MKNVRPVIALNWVPYLQLTLGGSHSISGREKEGKKKRMEREGDDLLFIESWAATRKYLS